MDEAEQYKERTNSKRSASGLRSLWATARALLRSLAMRARGGHGAVPFRDLPRPDDVERLYDIQWQISDSARRYRDLLDAQAGLIVHRDSEGRIVFANRAYLTAFGFSECELTGRRHDPHVLSTEPGPAARVIEETETVNGPRWIEWEETVCGVTPDGLTEMQQTGRDVTDERRAAEDLRRARDAALEGSRAKSRFLATMSHEIRTPMNGILGMTGLLLDGPLTGEQRTYAATIAQSGRALMSLIDEILDFSRIEAGKLILSEAPFAITDTVAACVALLQPKAADKGFEIAWRIDGEAPPLLCGDEARVRQILLNLMSNAVKFTDAGAVRITISAREAGANKTRVRLAVEDTGIGLSAGECEAIFAEFEQADAAVRRQDGGSGLGLAIARRIARAMQGDVAVTSVPGRGSTFTAEFLLDAANVNATAPRSTVDHAAPVTRAAIAATRNSDRPSRVLLAEDNAVNALLATRLLEKDGCQVVRVPTGDEAVAAVARSLAGKEPRFDLVLMDIYMPRLDGIEATRAIRRLLATSDAAGHRHLPIVAVTANAFAEDRQRYLAAGLDDYLSKPFDGEALRALLARWLGAKCQHSPAA